MSKIAKQSKPTVELRPSRIRREPVDPIGKRPSLVGRIQWDSREWEIRLAIAGIVFFSLAISATVIDLGELLSH
jgi:hypothetical protein